MKLPGAGGSRVLPVAVALTLILVLLIAASLAFGALRIDLPVVVAALAAPDSGSYEHEVVQSLRVPRTVLGLLVGAALGMSGAVIQGLMRNPLGEPGIFGINHGAAFAIVVGLSFFGVSDPAAQVAVGFVGALLGAGVILLLGSLGSRDLSSPRLALAGFVVGSLFAAWMSAVLLIDSQTLDVVRFWLIGSLAGRDGEIALSAAPFLLAGCVVLFASGGALNTLGLGEDAARSVGMNTVLVRLFFGFAVILAAGASVASAGPISFVGLAVPHMLRALVGTDYRKLVPLSALGGAVLLIGSDLAGRLIAMPSEIQVGTITAILGAPVLVYLVSRRRGLGPAT